MPGKNIRPIHGKPLIAWSIDLAQKSGLFDVVAVSSDDKKILDIAKKYGADLAIDRPPDLATDTSPKIGAIVHAVKSAEEKSGKTFDVIVDLDASSPLRNLMDLIGAVDLLENSDAPNVITGTLARRSPYFNQVEINAYGRVEISKKTSDAVVRRQDSPKVFDMNASIYVWRRGCLINKPSVFYSDTLLYEMPEERSHDIDTEVDFDIVETLMSIQYPNTRRFLNAHELTGRNVLLTGAAGILGRQFSMALAEHGANLILVDNSEDQLIELVDEINDNYSAKVDKYNIDVANHLQVKELIEKIEIDIGEIDVLHNNAATKGRDISRFFDEIGEYSPDIWHDVMDTNVAGYFYFGREVGQRMAKRGRGSIIQTASIYGVVGPDQRIYEGSSYEGRAINTPAVYSASKAAVIGLTRHFATLWGRQGVRVNTLTPGGVFSGQNLVFEKQYSERVPLGRMGSSEEIANAMIFLASDASSYITGQNLIVDGGLSCW